VHAPPPAKPASRQRTVVRAFTLIELLVSIAVIGILLGLLAPALRAVRRGAGVAQCRARLASIGVMVETFASEHAGALPTFDYPLDLQGVADPVLAPEWGAGGGGWLVLPISEIWFWAYQLRGYAAEDPDEQLLRAVEQLSCPVVYDEWLAALPPAERDGAVGDPMTSPQASYVRSVALFTAPGAWMDADDPPDVNAVHARRRTSDVAHPANKGALVEAAAHHERARTKLEAAQSERFNVLAADGHVERRRADASTPPIGFVGATTGFEDPPIARDRWRATGMRYISTLRGTAGRDW